MKVQYCRDCYLNLPEAAFKPSCWGTPGKTCRTCTNDYKRSTRDPAYDAQRKALKASVRRAICQEKAALRQDIIAVRKELREERAVVAEFKRCARDIGLDPEEMWQRYQEHDRHCEICGLHESQLDKRLHLDHCHATGVFRGFLCSKCNRALGLLGDTADGLARALKYLEHR